MFRPEDAVMFLADFGVPALWLGGTPAGDGLVLFDKPGDATLMGAEVISTDYTVTLVAADWPGLCRGHELVIGGRRYKLRTDIVPSGDGLFGTAPLTFEGPAP